MNEKKIGFRIKNGFENRRSNPDRTALPDLYFMSFFFFV